MEIRDIGETPNWEKAFPPGPSLAPNLQSILLITGRLVKGGKNSTRFYIKFPQEHFPEGTFPVSGPQKRGVMVLREGYKASFRRDSSESSWQMDLRISGKPPLRDTLILHCFIGINFPRFSDKTGEKETIFSHEKSSSKFPRERRTSKERE